MCIDLVADFHQHLVLSIKPVIKVMYYFVIGHYLFHSPVFAVDD